MATYNRKYTNGEITVYWQPDLCVHAGICLSELPRVFNARKRPWIDMSKSDTRSIIATVEDCPTNALMYSWNDEEKSAKDNSLKLLRDQKLLDRFEKEKQAAIAAKIKLQVDGPVIVTGTYELEHESGEKNVMEDQPCSICRCGKTKTPPFCDGSHMN